MLFEICAVTIIFITLFIWGVNPSREIRKKFGGKTLKMVNSDHPEYDEIIARVIIIFVLCIIGLIWRGIVISFMFVVGERIIFAKYYAIALIVIMVLSFTYIKIKNRNLDKIPMKESLRSMLYRHITTIITLVLLIWALMI